VPLAKRWGCFLKKTGHSTFNYVRLSEEDAPHLHTLSSKEQNACEIMPMLAVNAREIMPMLAVNARDIMPMMAVNARVINQGINRWRKMMPSLAMNALRKRRKNPLTTMVSVYMPYPQSPRWRPWRWAQ
jgi:hypothetical protein